MGGVELYERRDTTNVSSSSLPKETPHENQHDATTHIQGRPESNHQCIRHQYVSQDETSHLPTLKRPIIKKLQQIPEARPGWGVCPNEASTVGYINETA